MPGQRSRRQPGTALTQHAGRSAPNSVQEETSTAKKARLRQEISAELQKLSPAQRVSDSRAVSDRLRCQRIWTEARSVLLYAPLGEEVDIWGLVQESIETGRMTALPRFDRRRGFYRACRVQDLQRDIAVGHFGIREPNQECLEISLNQLDLILVPGVGFDESGRRLGRGKGYYDRLLAGARGTKCGLAFDCQWVNEIPAEPHDVKLDCIMTPSRWWIVV